MKRRLHSSVVLLYLSCALLFGTGCITAFAEEDSPAATGAESLQEKAREFLGDEENWREFYNLIGGVVRSYFPDGITSMQDLILNAENGEEAVAEADEAANDEKEAVEEKGDETADAAEEKGDETANAAEEKGDEAANAAEEKGDETADAAEEKGDETANAAEEKGDEAADAAEEKGDETADTAEEKGDEAAEEVVGEDETADSAAESAEDKEGVKEADSGNEGTDSLLGPVDEAVAAAAIADEIYAEAEAAEASVTAFLKSFESDKAHMEGLDYRLKTKESIARKLLTNALDMEVSVAEARGSIRDALRYTYVIEDEEYTAMTKQIIDACIENGYSVYKLKNTWDSPDYKGINMNLITPDAYIFELQFHTPESYDTKQNKTHEDYEIIRSVSSTAVEKAMAMVRNRLANMAVPVPEGALDISY